MLEFERNHQRRGVAVTSSKMPCLMLQSASSSSSVLGVPSTMSRTEELAELRTKKEGFLRGGLLLPLGWRESLGTDDAFPYAIDGDDWEEDDDVVDDDDDDDDEEEDDEDDDFFPDDDDEFEEDDDDDDDEEEEEEE